MQVFAKLPIPWRSAAAEVVVLIALMLTFGSASSALAQAATFPFAITQSRIPSGTGDVTITPMGSDQLMVAIHLTGLPATPTSRAAHIHTAQGAVCDNNSPVTYPLDAVAIDSSGTGTSTTMITLMPDKPIQANNAYVNVHEAGSPPGNGVICANITQSFSAGAASTGGSTTAGATTTTGTGTTAGTAAPVNITATTTTGASTTAATTTTSGATPTTAATTSTTASGSASKPMPTGPGGCWLYDSWCHYCSTHAGSDACKEYAPKALAPSAGQAVLSILEPTAAVMPSAFRVMPASTASPAGASD